MTKEPKLSAAVRIIPDWTNYDNEIKNLQRRFATSTLNSNQLKTEDSFLRLGALAFLIFSTYNILQT